MSTIPPNIVGPILQAGLAQRNVSRLLEAERDQQNTVTAATSRLHEKAAESVGETDRDSQVNPDAEGTGSQGRHLEGHEHSAPDTADGTDGDGGIHRDEDGRLHVDLEA